MEQTSAEKIIHSLAGKTIKSVETKAHLGEISAIYITTTDGLSVYLRSRSTGYGGETEIDVE